MSTVSRDLKSIYVESEIPTGIYVKIISSALSILIIAFFTYLAVSLQEDKPRPLAFLLPISCIFLSGKFLLWNIFGKENLIISTSHISYQHSYGFWKSNLSTQHYDEVIVELYDVEVFDHPFNLSFVTYDGKTKLQQSVFKTAIKINFENFQVIFSLIEELKIDEGNPPNNAIKANCNF